MTVTEILQTMQTIPPMKVLSLIMIVNSLEVDTRTGGTGMPITTPISAR